MKTHYNRIYNNVHFRGHCLNFAIKQNFGIQLDVKVIPLFFTAHDIATSKLTKMEADFIAGSDS